MHICIYIHTYIHTYKKKANKREITMAVRVRRWNWDEETKKRNDDDEHSLFKEKSRAKLSLNRTLLAISKPTKENKQIFKVEIVNMIDKSPKLMFKNNFIAKQYLWRAIRHVPIVSKNSHVPIPDSKLLLNVLGIKFWYYYYQTNLFNLLDYQTHHLSPPKRFDGSPGISF